jgi:hypothetical protein
LKKPQNFDAGISGRTPELNAICPDGFEYCFVDEEFVAGREFVGFCLTVTGEMMSVAKLYRTSGTRPRVAVALSGD